jgi:hypothetical protein
MSDHGTAPAKGGPYTKVVEIFPGNPPRVSEDPVILSKSANEEVEWTCPENFSVTMNGTSPFTRKVFTPAYNRSGVPILTPDPKTELYFKYSVEVGGHTADPGVIVNP